jgi:NDP-sugar pyrophosphorylase family protein
MKTVILAGGFGTRLSEETVNRPEAELAADSQPTVYRHEGFWQPMDTLRDKRYLEEPWTGGRAPWVNAPVRA